MPENCRETEKYRVRRETRRARVVFGHFHSLIILESHHEWAQKRKVRSTAPTRTVMP